MQLKTYKSLEDKEAVFNNRLYVVNTKEELMQFFESLDKERDSIKQHQEKVLNNIASSGKSKEAQEAFKKNFPLGNILVFRGVKEAKYKLYTSAQRYLYSHDLFSTYNMKSFMRKEIEALKTNKPLMDYWRRIGLTVSDLLCLCYLQHYEAATPLLDFTKDRNVGLFFMQDNMDYPPIGSNDKIDNYCSLYYQTMRQDLDIMNIFVHGAENAAKMVEEYQKQYKISVDTEETAKELEKLNIDSFYDSESVLWLDNTSSKFDIKSLNINISTVITNLNLEAQKGCFVINLSSKKPYEDKHLKCCDIHKSLVPFIRDHIKLTHDDIYPLDRNIAKAALNSALML